MLISVSLAPAANGCHATSVSYCNPTLLRLRQPFRAECDRRAHAERTRGIRVVLCGWLHYDKTSKHERRRSAYTPTRLRGTPHPNRAARALNASLSMSHSRTDTPRARRSAPSSSHAATGRAHTRSRSASVTSPRACRCGAACPSGRRRPSRKRRAALGAEGADGGGWRTELGEAWGAETGLAGPKVEAAAETTADADVAELDAEKEVSEKAVEAVLEEREHAVLESEGRPIWDQVAGRKTGGANGALARSIFESSDRARVTKLNAGR